MYMAVSASAPSGIRSISNPEKLMIFRSGSCRSWEAT
jgi:hypothetical protein